MKKIWKSAKFKIGVTIAVLGGIITGYVVKTSGTKPSAGVVVNGDTVLQSGGDSIKADTAKLN